jgi:hypothetical protein
MMIMKGGKMVYTKESIRSLLKNNVLKVVFTKTDGSVREMRCSLQEQFIEVYEKKTDKVKPENDNIISVWDLDNNGWRSFKVDSIQSVSFIAEANNV